MVPGKSWVSLDDRNLGEATARRDAHLQSLHAHLDKITKMNLILNYSSILMHYLIFLMLISSFLYLRPLNEEHA